MARQDFDLELRRFDGRGWRATFFPSGVEHSFTGGAGSAWATTHYHLDVTAGGQSTSVTFTLGVSEFKTLIVTIKEAVAGGRAACGSIPGDSFIEKRRGTTEDDYDGGNHASGDRDRCSDTDRGGGMDRRGAGTEERRQILGRPEDRPAMNAPPPEISRKAAILDIGADGQIKQLRVGRNGWVCMTESSGAPMCLDKE